MSVFDMVMKFSRLETGTADPKNVTPYDPTPRDVAPSPGTSQSLEQPIRSKSSNMIPVNRVKDYDFKKSSIFQTIETTELAQKFANAENVTHERAIHGVVDRFHTRSWHFVDLLYQLPKALPR